MWNCDIYSFNFSCIHLYVGKRFAWLHCNLGSLGEETIFPLLHILYAQVMKPLCLKVNGCFFKTTVL